MKNSGEKQRGGIIIENSENRPCWRINNGVTSLRQYRMAKTAPKKSAMAREKQRRIVVAKSIGGIGMPPREIMATGKVASWRRRRRPAIEASALDNGGSKGKKRNQQRISETAAVAADNGISSSMA